MSESEPERCQRCHKSITGGRSVVRVDPEPLGSKALSMVLCASCFDSFQRWTSRHERRSKEASRSPSGFDSVAKASTHRRRKHRPLTLTAARERQAARLRIRLIFLTALIALVVYGGICLLGFFLMSKP